MKKMLCALLAAVLTLTLMLPCAAADFAGFTDQQEIKNNNAVRMLYDLGLISGYADSSFGPQNPIRREEVAKLMALLCEAEPQAQNASESVIPSCEWNFSIHDNAAKKAACRMSAGSLFSCGIIVYWQSFLYIRPTA